MGLCSIFVFQISEALKREAESKKSKNQNITFLTDNGLIGGCGLVVEQHELPDRNLVLEQRAHSVMGSLEHPEASSWVEWRLPGGGADHLGEINHLWTPETSGERQTEARSFEGDSFGAPK